MTEKILEWVTQFGYIGIFSLLMLGIVGLPIPDETLLAFAGYLVYKGTLQLIPTLICALLGSVCGITLSYSLGRTVGICLINKYGHIFHVSGNKIDQVHQWFERTGRWALFLGYYVPGVRHLTAYVAGTSKLQLPIFALFAYAGAFVWSTTFVSLGYFLGEKWTEASQEIHRSVLVGFSIIFVCLSLYLLVQRRQNAKRRT
jgi:membrane protein DedA with SNARE-associated domain